MPVFKQASGRLVRERYQRSGHECPVVSAEVFVSQSEAKSVLRLRTYAGLRHLIARGLLEPCFRHDLDAPHTSSMGVTRRSLDAEARWWSEASWIAKVGRRFSGLLRWG